MSNDLKVKSEWKILNDLRKANQIDQYFEYCMMNRALLLVIGKEEMRLERLCYSPIFYL